MRISRLWPVLAIALFLSACGDGTAAGKAVEGAGASAAVDDVALANGFVIENSTVIPLVSESEGRRRYDVYVKTPPGYGDPKNAGRRYPVMYLTDGPYTFQVASGLSRLPFSQGRFREFIIVGLSYAEGEAAADSRRRDLTPWTDPEVNGVSGGSRAYLDFMKQQVLPLVEGRYRTDPAERTLVGQSYGGLFGLWAAFEEPGLFRNYILTSPSIWFADRAILKSEAAYAAGHADLRARFYFATGGREHPGPGGCNCDTDMVADQARLVALLNSRHYPGLEVRARVVEDAFHETTFPIGLMQGMQWLYLKD